jgi:hypothetical protein
MRQVSVQQLLDMMPLREEELLREVPWQAHTYWLKLMDAVGGIFDPVCIAGRQESKEVLLGLGAKLIYLLPLLVFAKAGMGAKHERAVKDRCLLILNGGLFTRLDQVHPRILCGPPVRPHARDEAALAARNIASAQRACDSGRLSKGAQRLMSKGLAPRTQETLEKLKCLFPSSPLPSDQVPLSSPSSVSPQASPSSPQPTAGVEESKDDMEVDEAEDPSSAVDRPEPPSPAEQPAVEERTEAPSSDRLFDTCLMLDIIPGLPLLTAPGPGGFTYELLLPLTNEHPRNKMARQAARRSFAHFLNVLFEGGIPPEERQLFRQVHLIPVPKTDSLQGPIRPIAVMGSLVRLVSIMANKLATKSGAFTRLAPLQMGVGTKDGAGILAHTMAAAREILPEGVILQEDISNAYGSIHREAVGAAIERDLPIFKDYWSWLYGTPLPAVFELEDGTLAELSIDQGLNQGDPSAGGFFAVTVQPALREVAEAHTGVLAMSYYDDNFSAGHMGQVAEAAALRATLLGQLGLVVNNEKSRVLCGSAEAYQTCIDADLFSGASIVKLTEGVKLLGCPVGSPEFQLEVLTDAVDGAVLLMEAVTKLKDRQTRLALLRRCVLPRIDFLSRFLPPSEPFKIQLKRFDEAIQVHFFDYIGLHPPEGDGADLIMERLGLPIKDGGMGLLSRSERHSAAYLAGTLSATRGKTGALFRSCWKGDSDTQISRFEDAKRAWSDVVLHSDSSKSPLFTHGDDGSQELKLSLYFESGDTNVPKQHDISAAIMAKTLSSFIDQAGAADVETQARIFSTKGIGTSEYLTASRRLQHFRLSSLEFRIAVAFRLGLPLPEAECALSEGTCILCKTTGISDASRHSLHCWGARSDYLRHDALKRTFMDIALASGRSGMLEYEFPNRGSETFRMDGVIPAASSTGGTLAYDVTVPDPLTPSWLSTAAQGPGKVARKAARTKHVNYDEATRRMDWEFLAPVVEMGGRMGDDALKFLSLCAERAGAEGCAQDDGNPFQRYWRTRISVAHQAAIGQSTAKFMSKHLAARSTAVQRRALAECWASGLSEN